MVDSRWYFGIAALLLVFVLVRLLRSTPEDADRAWQRQESLYRQRGLMTQRPEDWEHSYRQSRVGLVVIFIVFALIVLWFITRVYAL